MRTRPVWRPTRRPRPWRRSPARGGSGSGSGSGSRSRRGSRSGSGSGSGRILPGAPNLREKGFVQAGVRSQLGMEGDGEHRALTCRHRATVDLGQDVHRRTVLDDEGSPDEHRPHGAARHTPQIEVGLEAAHLTTERIALAGQIHHPEVMAIEHDKPGAGAQHGCPARSESAQGRGQALALHAEAHGGGLAARHDEPVEPVEVGRDAHLTHASPEGNEHARVGSEPTLK